MKPGSFTRALAESPVILAEGGVVERLKRDPSVAVDEHVLTASLLYDTAGACALAAMYRQYIRIGRAAELPMICLTPTWRANPERIQKAGLEAHDVNGDAVRFLRQIAGEFGDYAPRVFIGGLIACKGDAYRPEESLALDEAARFHRAQLQALAAAAADFLIAETLPAASEARGIAEEMSATGLPYVLSFVIRPDGCLLDAVSLHDLITELDAASHRAPAGYMANCVHHSALSQALRQMPASSRARVLGCQANTSVRTPDELDGLEYLDTEEPESFAAGLVSLHRDYGLRILGGCCGSDHRHIEALAKLLKETATV